MRAAAGISTDQRLSSTPIPLRQLRQGQLSSGDVVGGGVGACVAGPQQPDHRLTAATPAVVDEAHQRVMAEGLLPGRGRILLVGVRDYQHPVDVHDHLSAGIRCPVTRQLPQIYTDFGTGRAQCVQGSRPARGEHIDQPGDDRVGGHRPEHGRLSPQQPDMRQAVPAEGDRKRHIQQDLVRLMHRPSLTPRRQRRRYRLIQPGLAHRLNQQHGPGLRDHPATTALYTDTRVRPDTLLHLRSAPSTATDRTLEKSYRCRSGALLTFVIKSRTGRLVKARG